MSLGRKRGYANKARQLARRGLNTRKSRINSGQVVMFQKIRNRRVRRGRRVAFGNNPVKQTQNTVVPVAQAVQTYVNQDPTTILRRTEPAQALYSVAANNGVVGPDSIYMVVPTNPKLCPALAPTAVNYQYYTFTSMTVRYTPNQAFDQEGMIAICPIPSTQSINDVSSYDQVVGAAHSVSSSTKVGFTFTVPKEWFNTTLKRYAIVPYADLNNTAVDAIQGFLVWSTQGFNAEDDNKLYGTFTVTYQVKLMQHQLSTSSDPPGMHAEVNTVSFETLAHALHEKLDEVNEVWRNPSFPFEDVHIGGDTRLQIHPLYKKPFFLILQADYPDGGTPNFTINEAGGYSQIRFTRVQTILSQFLSYHVYLIEPTGNSPTFQLVFDYTGTAAGASHAMIHTTWVRPRDAQALFAALNDS